MPAQRQAVLPEDVEEYTLSSMNTGDVAWTLPWGMWVDRARRCWLHPSYPAESQPGGTVQMRVELREDGYHVWLPADQRYSPQDQPAYVSPRDLEYLPVVELHRL